MVKYYYGLNVNLDNLLGKTSISHHMLKK